jgi:two-component system LytT family response regulator
MLARSEQIDQIQACASISEAGEQIIWFRPDVIFLDIQMPGGTGFDLLERLKHGTTPVVIFTTAFAQFAPKAFDVQACDYLLKPFDEERLALALDRAGEALRHNSRRFRSPTRITVPLGSRSVRLTAQDIDWMAAEDNYVRIHSGTQELLARSTLEKLERDLKDGTLLRVHRSWIVNINRVKEIRRGEKQQYSVILEDGTAIKCSRRYKRQLRTMFRI